MIYQLLKDIRRIDPLVAQCIYFHKLFIPPKVNLIPFREQTQPSRDSHDTTTQEAARAGTRCY